MFERQKGGGAVSTDAALAASALTMATLNNRRHNVFLSAVWVGADKGRTGEEAPIVLRRREERRIRIQKGHGNDNDGRNLHGRLHFERLGREEDNTGELTAFSSEATATTA